MGGSSKTTNQTQYTNQNSSWAPWAPAQQSLQKSLDAANNAFDTTYNGSSVAALDPLVTQGQNRIVANANKGAISGLANVGIGGYTDLLKNGGVSAAGIQGLGDLNTASSALNPYVSGQYLQPGQNPYLDAVLKTAGDQAAAGVNGQFSAAGRYGSGAQAGVLGDTIGNIQTNARMQDYNQQQQKQIDAIKALAEIGNSKANIGQQGVGNIGSAVSALPALAQGQNADATALLGVGGQRMDYNQSVINAANQDPWTKAQDLAQIAGGVGQLGGTSNQSGMSQTNQTQQTNSGIAGTIGGILSGIGGATNLATGLGKVGGWSGMFSNIFPFLGGSNG